MKFPRNRRKGAAASRLDATIALARADELVAIGDLAAAIDILRVAERDPRIDILLVRLRQELFERTRWPEEIAPFPTTPDLFPDVSGLPEVTAADLSAECLRSGILHHGSLVVRGLFTQEQSAHIRDNIDRAFTAFDAFDPSLPTNVDPQWFTPYEGYTDLGARQWVRNGGGILAIDSPTAMFDMIEMFETAGLRAVVDGFLGEQGVLLGKKWTLRRVPRDLSVSANWHQDGAFMGKDIRSLNLWIALSHCGDDAPGLDLVAERLNYIVETGTGGADLSWTVGPETVRRLAADRVVRPVFEAGDAVLFDHMNLHRTAIDPGMPNDRYAVEAWFLAPSTYAALTALGNAGEPSRTDDQMPLVF